MRSLPAPPPRPCTAGGRPSPLANPYAFGRDGNREKVIAQYRRWLWAQLQSPSSPQEREIKRLLTQAQSGEL